MKRFVWVLLVLPFVLLNIGRETHIWRWLTNSTNDGQGWVISRQGHWMMATLRYRDAYAHSHWAPDLKLEPRDLWG